MSNYQNKAIQLVADETGLPPSAFYVVWFCKTLQNWKALISTDTINNHYWEVTYNGDKSEAYIDEYLKTHNVAVPTTE